MRIEIFGPLLKAEIAWDLQTSIHDPTSLHEMIFYVYDSLIVLYFEL